MAEVKTQANAISLGLSIFINKGNKQENKKHGLQTGKHEGFTNNQTPRRDNGPGGNKDIN